VSILNSDGRYFAHTTPRKFDIVQIVGADSDTSNLTSGALAVSENYLYTKEAFIDYLSALRPHGLLSVMRFGPREPLVILSSSVAAMRALGFAHPEDHVAVINHDVSTDVLIQQTPFSTEEVNDIERLVRDVNALKHDDAVPISDLLGFSLTGQAAVLYAPGAYRGPDNAFALFMQSVREGREAAFAARFPSRIDALTDDHPFFYQYEKPETLFVYRNSVLYSLLKAVGAIAAVCLVVCAGVIARWSRRRAPGHGGPIVAPLLHMFCLGFGFALTELTLIQKSSLELGHPSYAFLTVTVALVGFAGLGAVLLGDDPKRGWLLRPWSLAGIVGILLGFRAGLPGLYASILPTALVARLGVAMLALAPLGLLLGIPFPLALAWIKQRDPRCVPAALGVNTLGAVLGAAAAIPAAMLSDFSTVFLAAASAYGLALLLVLVGDWRADPRREAEQA
jgi:hypothetical protein